MTRRSESDATGSLEGGSPASADLRAALKSRADLLRRRAQAPAAMSQVRMPTPSALCAPGELTLSHARHGASGLGRRRSRCRAPSG